MTETIHKITEAELPDYKGKKVDTRQLEDVTDIYMILTNVETIDNPVGTCYVEGILDEFSKEKIRISKRNSALVYNPSYLRGGWASIEF